MGCNCSVLTGDFSRSQSFKNNIQNPSMATPLTVALDLCKEIKERYGHLSSAADKICSFRIYEQQCKIVYNSLVETQGTLQSLHCELPDAGTSFPDVRQATQELVQVLKRAYETFFNHCFCSEWMKSAFKQHGDLKETVRGILYDLQWCRSVLCSILFKRAGHDSHALKPEDCDGTLRLKDGDDLSTAAKKDEENLKALLTVLKANHSCSGECWNGKQVSAPCLAAQLLEMIDFRAQPKTDKMSCKHKFLENDTDNLRKWPFGFFTSPEDRPKGHLLGSGVYGDVYNTVWLGETFAMKIPKRGPGCKKVFKQEIAALAGLHHPHVMRLVCCAELPRECSYIMELMDTTLSKMLEEGQISDIPQAVDLMLQVAEGMKYLHSLSLVHRDLKPDNILVKKVQEVDADPNSTSDAQRTSPVWVAKVSDFGTSKAKNESTAYANQTVPIGTPMYMAPELYPLESGDKEPEKVYPMRADVYSFGMVCWAAVTGNPSPFESGELWPTRDFKNSVRRGKRPALPLDCPALLTRLIKSCWDGSPLSRPVFHDICRELRHIKALLILTDEKSTLVTLPPQQDQNEGFQQTQGVAEQTSRVPVCFYQGYDSDSSYYPRLENTWVQHQVPYRFSSYPRMQSTFFGSDSSGFEPRILGGTLQASVGLMHRTWGRGESDEQEGPWGGSESDGESDVQEGPWGGGESAGESHVQEGHWGGGERGVQCVPLSVHWTSIPNRIESAEQEGPWGGGKSGGQFVQFCVHWTPMPIRSIEIHHETGPTPAIWHLEIVHEENDYTATSTHGAKVYPGLAHSNKDKISLEPHEFLTQIEGYEGSAGQQLKDLSEIHALTGLTFHTNVKSYGPYGGGKEQNFAHFQSSVGKIGGFFGFCSDDISEYQPGIASLGVFMSDL